MPAVFAASDMWSLGGSTVARILAEIPEVRQGVF